MSIVSCASPKNCPTPSSSSATPGSGLGTVAVALRGQCSPPSRYIKWPPSALNPSSRSGTMTSVTTQPGQDLLCCIGVLTRRPQMTFDPALAICMRRFPRRIFVNVAREAVRASWIYGHHSPRQYFIVHVIGVFGIAQATE